MANEEYSVDAEGQPRWGSRAAGALFERTDDGRILLALRSDEVMDPGVWGLPGGRVEKGEEDFDAAIAEAEEELGSIPPRLEVVGSHRARSGGFTYVTFHVLVDGEDAEAWRPKLNWENTDWGWFSVEELPEPLHPGVVEVLEEMSSGK